MAHLLFPATDYFKFRPKVPKYQGEGWYFKYNTLPCFTDDSVTWSRVNKRLDSDSQLDFLHYYQAHISARTLLDNLLDSGNKARVQLNSVWKHEKIGTGKWRDEIQRTQYNQQTPSQQMNSIFLHILLEFFSWTEKQQPKIYSHTTDKSKGYTSWEKGRGISCWMRDLSNMYGPLHRCVCALAVFFNKRHLWGWLDHRDRPEWPRSFQNQ